MTPEQLKALFDGNAIIIIFAWGLICKYVPFLKAIPNVVIPWVGAIGYIITRLVIPDAHAAEAAVVTGQSSTISTLFTVLIGGFTNSIWARQLFEGFGRHLFEGMFKLKKA
jgi:hypothetical protein